MKTLGTLFLILTLGLVFSSQISALGTSSINSHKAPKTKENLKINLSPLNDITNKYRQSRMVRGDLVKTVKAEITGRESTTEGMIALAGGNFRVETQKPEKTILVYDGKVLWNEQSPSADFGGPAQVTRQLINKGNQSQIMFATLLTKDPITKHFNIKSAEESKGTVTYNADPLQADLNVKDFKITLDLTKKIVSQISFKDDIGNLTTMNFSNIRFSDNIDKKLFSYKPPKDAQVTKL
jgi:outer membrane lipoprotein carrier protein